METGIAQLREDEKKILYGAPALVAVMASLDENGKVDADCRADAVKLAHLRTFTSTPLLHGFYEEADRHFEERFSSLAASLPADKQQINDFFRFELVKVSLVAGRLHKDFSEAFAASMKSFVTHVLKSRTSVLDHFFLPVVLNEFEKAFER